MKDSRELAERVARGIAASSRTSATPPGRTEPAAPEAAQREHASAERIEAINQVFALFRLNYHNQYYAAFPDASQLNQIKKLWLDSLAHYPVTQILRGARHAIEHSEFLPTLNRMHQSCRACYDAHGLPTAHAAYLEACNAPSPKADQRWSHPAVYLAGRDSDWFILANRSEQESWPIFSRHYATYCQRVADGEELSLPERPALEKDSAPPMSLQARRAALQALRDETGL